ncbi:hypothetical protein ACSYAD_31010 [Acaryochloris marina NIES-2412]|uniref:hypothetical protein n=1 Tax=Acaryochloris marina TaxID=155978 RepID=UPI004058D6FA
MTDLHINALDLAMAGKWHEAHELVEHQSDQTSCLIHGYLHRVEGDLSNARYWYRRAGEGMPDNTLAEELRCLHKVIYSTQRQRQ